MNEKYYLALFSEETWNEFLEKGSSVYGTTLKEQKRMEATNPGDMLICYVAKLSFFVGLLEITSKAYTDEHPIWKNDIYPIRVNVRPIYSLKAINGVPVSKLREKLLIFGKLKDPRNWGTIFRRSLNELHKHDAKLIIEELKTVSNE